METLKEHWNSIFSKTNDTDLGWYEEDISQTLKFLREIPHSESKTVFLPGSGTSTLVDALLNQGHQLILNDISNEALNKLKNRLRNDENTTYLHHDISKPLPLKSPKVDLWIDRAVLHFLLNELDIETYFNNLCSSVKPGGFVLLAEFSTIGALKCAGLDVHRYSVSEINDRIGNEFKLIKDEEYKYINPSGNERPYIYALYKREG
ncbi:class I SAM-dependent methyltransferase [Sulfurimonas sp.]|uniref:class I SAM-dependent methyltransferase n=1 Tax=Sulfurimonas sp. TaxID=2022749 RepID=UPI003566F1DE